MSQTNHRQTLALTQLKMLICPYPRQVSARGHVLFCLPFLSLSLTHTLSLFISLYLPCVLSKLHLRRCKIVAPNHCLVCLSFIPPAHLLLLSAALSSQRIQE
ncbi:hypothetical protein V8C40DRAFT_245200 [Trichoderma camerunense]